MPKGKRSKRRPVSWRSSLRDGLALYGAFALARPLLIRGAVIGGVAVASSVTTAHLVTPTVPAPSPPAISQPWLTRVGGVQVQRLYGRCTGQPVDLAIPPKGVGHTVEGSLESGMSVFAYHYRPHFLLGRDRAGQVRLVQYCPLGEMAAALKNLAGGVETNRWARAQIELAGYSRKPLWLPDVGVQRVYAALLLKLRDVAGIPLRRAQADGIGPRLSADAWRRGSGWYNHSEVPENDHWDAGSLRWSKLLARAQSLAPVVGEGHPLPARTPILGKPRATAARAAAWARARRATATFVRLAAVYWVVARARGVRPEVAYAQAAIETGFGRYGGVVPRSYHNLCGLKTRTGGGDEARTAHKRFRTWRQGVIACVDHLALYAGAPGYPRRSSPDERQFAVLLGRAKTVEALGGQWATPARYGEQLRTAVRSLLHA